MNVPFVFCSRVVFDQRIKIYGTSQQVTRYSPAKVTCCEKIHPFGIPDMDKVCTSHVGRFNLTMRMDLRRLTNGHSKSLKHHLAMQNIMFAWYNFARPHESFSNGTAPAMAVGLENHKWTIKEMIEQAGAA